MAESARKPQGKSKPVKPAEPSYERCREHEREVILYCNECQEPICPVCLSKFHRGHDVVDIQQENIETLTANIHDLHQDLTKGKEKLLETKKEVQNNLKACVKNLKTMKKEHVEILTQKYDEMIKEATKQEKDVTAELEKDVAAIDKNFMKLDIARMNVKESSRKSDDATSTLKEANQIVTQVKSILTKKRVYKYLEYMESQATVEEVERLCGVLTRKETCVQLKKTEERTVKRYTGRVQISEVTQTIATKFRDEPRLALLGTTALVWGHADDDYKVVQYDLQTGRESWGFKFAVHGECAGGMAEVTLDGRPCLAIACEYYDRKARIEFRDARDLDKVLHNHAAEWRGPGVICTTSPSTLLYADRVKLKQLDCSGYKPKLMKGDDPEYGYIPTDMCCVQDGKKELLVKTFSYTTAQGTIRNFGMGAYDLRTQGLEYEVEPEWTINDKQDRRRYPMVPKSVTTDGRGHLFVCDSKENTVQMFTPGGELMGCLLRVGEQGVAKPRKIRWCEAMSSLIVLSENSKGKCDIMVINLE